MKLGFIGLGIMGTPMAINLARAGHQLHVTTIDRLLMNYCHSVPLMSKPRAR